MSDAKLTDCPECHTPGLRKQLTAAAFKLKGTGWYETDFKNSGKQPGKKQPTEGQSDSNESSSGNAAQDSSADSATSPDSATSMSGTT